MIKYIKTFHERIKEVDIDNIRLNNNPYSLCFGWLLDVTIYGLLITSAINIWFGWQGYKNIGLVFFCGVIRWLFLDIIGETFKAARGKT